LEPPETPDLQTPLPGRRDIPPPGILEAPGEPQISTRHECCLPPTTCEELPAEQEKEPRGASRVLMVKRIMRDGPTVRMIIIIIIIIRTVITTKIIRIIRIISSSYPRIISIISIITRITILIIMV
jgi:hypothetical protein